MAPTGSTFSVSVGPRDVNIVSGTKKTLKKHLFRALKKFRDSLRQNLECTSIINCASKLLFWVPELSMVFVYF